MQRVGVSPRDRTQTALCLGLICCGLGWFGCASPGLHEFVGAGAGTWIAVAEQSRGRYAILLFNDATGEQEVLVDDLKFKPFLVDGSNEHMLIWSSMASPHEENFYALTKEDKQSRELRGFGWTGPEGRQIVRVYPSKKGILATRSVESSGGQVYERWSFPELELQNESSPVEHDVIMTTRASPLIGDAGEWLIVDEIALDAATVTLRLIDHETLEFMDIMPLKGRVLRFIDAPGSRSVWLISGRIPAQIFDLSVAERDDGRIGFADSPFAVCSYAYECTDALVLAGNLFEIFEKQISVSDLRNKPNVVGVLPKPKPEKGGTAFQLDPPIFAVWNSNGQIDFYDARTLELVKSKRIRVSRSD